MKKVYLIVTTLLLLCACGEDIETEEERLVYDPYDAKIEGICYLLSADTHTATVTAGDVYYRGDVVIPETVQYGGTTYQVTSIAPRAFFECQSRRSVKLRGRMVSCCIRPIRSGTV